MLEVLGTEGRGLVARLTDPTELTFVRILVAMTRDALAPGAAVVHHFPSQRHLGRGNTGVALAAGYAFVLAVERERRTAGMVERRSLKPGLGVAHAAVFLQAVAMHVDVAGRALIEPHRSGHRGRLVTLRAGHFGVRAN